MKAIVIKTTYYCPINEGGVVDIVPNMEADAADVYNAPVGKCFLCKCPNGKLIYAAATCLQIIDEDINSDPDYWTRLEHQAAIAAMGGICGNTSYDESTWESMAEDAILAAHALIQKLKEKEERK